MGMNKCFWESILEFANWSYCCIERELKSVSERLERNQIYMPYSGVVVK